jgi:hypothetical protein
MIVGDGIMGGIEGRDCGFLQEIPAVEGFEGSHLVFVAAGPDPFDVITNAVK